MITIVPIILCGGSGTRLWPLSRNGFPKQFLALSGTNSLFQQTVERSSKISNQQIRSVKPIIVTNEEHRFLAVEQLRELKIEADFLLEPAGRNTAPALTLASFMVKEQYSDQTVMVVMPSDQTIIHENKWVDAIRNSIYQASSGGIVTLGITPTHPETGYGYIQKQHESNQHHAFEVSQFTEKPNLEVAKQYLDSKNYLWNSGIFILQSGVWLAAMERFSPEIIQQTQIAWQGKSIDHGGFVDFVRPNKEAFLNIISDSIDYAVIEKCPGKLPIHVVPLDAGWSDLGAWDAVWSVGQKDQHQNVTHGDVLLHDTSNSYVHATQKLVGVVGLKNIVVIEKINKIQE